MASQALVVNPKTPPPSFCMVYAATTLLHPTMRIARFQKTWIRPPEGWIQVIESHYREIWTTEYLPRLSKDLPDSYTREVMSLG